MVFKTARKIAIGVIGGTVVLLGIIMIVAPGPAFIVIPAGLAILATEFAFAARILRKLKERMRAAAQSVGIGSGSAEGPAKP